MIRMAAEALGGGPLPPKMKIADALRLIERNEIARYQELTEALRLIRSHSTRLNRRTR